MKEDYGGENTGADEQLKDLLSKTSTPSYIGIAAICRKIVKKTARSAAGHFASLYALRQCLISVFVRGICVYLLALKAQGQNGVNAQGKTQPFLLL